MESGEKMRKQYVVALLAEGVDRNMGEAEETPWMPASPSSRRAWIEIVSLSLSLSKILSSPSSRRAWIEMLSHRTKACVPLVALLAEGVDRNARELLLIVSS